MSLAPDPKEAAAFLGRLFPDSPWVVSAIYPDMGDDGIQNRIFGVATRGDFVSWMAPLNEQGWNIYYAVNELAPGVRRAHKTDVTAVRYLHVDLDPRVWNKDEDGGTYLEHLDKERQRIADKLRCPPNNIPVPTAAISSGGGCNALWRLAEPIRLDRTVERAEEAERYNIALVTAFGENNCHDVSRVLRMPFTLNWPNKTKRDKGRTGPILATLLWESAEAYPLGLFRQVEPRQTNGVGSGRGRPKTMVPGNIAPITDIADIRQYAKNKERITDGFLNIVLQGVEAPEAEKFASDSSRLILYVAGELMRAGVPDPQIFAIITEPTFACSRHALKHRGGARRAAQRALDRAKDTMGPNGDVLLELNDNFFVVGDYGGKCVVVQETVDPVTDRKELRYQSPDHFYNRYAHRAIVIEQPEGSRKKAPEKIPLGKWWFTNPRSRRVERVAFSPGRELSDNVYNLWQGFAVDPIPGTAHELYLDHLRTVVCNGDEENYRYLLGWMADCVQRPGRPGQVAVVMRGGQGTGKGTVCHYFGKMWGRHYMQVTNPAHLVGKFNQHLADLVVLFADEAFFAGDKEHEGVLKTLITEERSTTEKKGYDIEQGLNYLHLLMASNKNWVVPTDADDRRYFVLDVPTLHHAVDYFPKLRKSMDLVEEGGEGGVCNLLYFLQTYDLSAFNAANRPNTKGLATQKMLTLPTDQDWWHSRLENGSMPRGRAWTDPVPVDEIYNDYITYATKQSSGPRLKKVGWSRNMFEWVRGLRKKRESVAVFDELTREKLMVSQNCYYFPPLAECRQQWDTRLSTTTAWPEEEVAPF